MARKEERNLPFERLTTNQVNTICHTRGNTDTGYVSDSQELLCFIKHKNIRVRFYLFKETVCYMLTFYSYFARIAKKKKEKDQFYHLEIY